MENVCVHLSSEQETATARYTGVNKLIREILIKTAPFHVIYLYAYILRFLLFNYGTYFLTFVRSLGHRDQVQVLENRYTQVSKVLGIQLFKSFEFGNGSRMSDKNLVILEFKYLQNKIWQKQAVKTASYLQLVIEHNDYFHFTQITDKNLQFSFKNWQFSMFTAFSLHS